MFTSENKINLQQKRWNEAWEHKFMLTEKFIKEFGRMPLVRETYEGVCLYRWLILEKSKYLNGNMNDAIVKRFASIGVDIAHFSARPKSNKTAKKDSINKNNATRISYDEIFEQELEILKQFLKLHGRFPDSGEFYEEYPIGQRCDRWRRLYRNKQFSERRIKKLNLIDFPWTSTELKWRKNYLFLVQFLDKLGRLPMVTESYQNVQLGSWLYHQRQLYRKNKIDPKHLELLEMLDFMNVPGLRHK